MTIGRGPWARLFATAVVPDESSAVAEQGRQLVEAVQELTVETGRLSASVDGCEVTISAAPVPPRIWTAIARASRTSQQLVAAIEGRAQSVHLEHLMTLDWERPLVPRTRELVRTCTCDRGGTCEHLAAVAYTFALEIDRDPSALLRWRGVDAVEDAFPVPVRAEPAPLPADAWEAGPLPEPRPLRPLPPGAVLKRLGPSGMKVDDRDLAEVLQRAYVSFAGSSRT